MWLWTKLLKPFLEWTGHYESVQAILHTEVYKRTLGPLLSGGTVAVLGISEGIQWMWVAMASSVTVMAVTSARIRLAEWAEKNNPEHKLVVMNALFACDLDPVDVPEKEIGSTGNRLQRRSGTAPRHVIPAQTLSAGQLRADINRTFSTGQVLVEVKNTAPFPMSMVLVSAETEVEGMRPPRSVFPKPSSTLGPGITANIPDDSINMDGFPCGKMTGKLKMKIKYGRPGKERFELNLIADLTINVERFGMVTQVFAGWKNA